MDILNKFCMVIYMCAPPNCTTNPNPIKSTFTMHSPTQIVPQHRISLYVRNGNMFVWQSETWGLCNIFLWPWNSTTWFQWRYQSSTTTILKWFLKSHFHTTNRLICWTNLLSKTSIFFCLEIPELQHTVDGSEIRRSPVEVGSLSHYL